MGYTGDMDTLNFDGYLPEGQDLYPFQHVGVASSVYACQDGLGAMLADEQGLGKTRQAIVGAKVHADIFGYEARTLIVCKAALKANWEREIGDCAPEWDVQVLGGKRPYRMTSNVAIISFNLLATWADALVAEGFTSLIIDESHSIKDPKAQQSKAARRIAEDIRTRKGYVVLLTGTPLLNRPVELVNQLEVIGRLQQVSPAPRKANPTLTDWQYAFMFTFCGPKRNAYGKWEFKGASKLDLLNTNMRDHFYTRRLRNEVLDMSDTHRIHTPLSLNGALKPYLDVEKNFVGSGDPRSFIIELLGALRKSISECKVEASLEWIQTYIEENPGKKLVVWAWHVEAQEGLTNALNAAGINAVCLRTEQAKGRIAQATEAFNRGDTEVLVCSLRAHAEGHTFVGNGHNVTDCLFHEQPWHPGNVAQAEDRINRIGQNAEAVFATTLIVPETVDTWLEDLIAGKWEVFKRAADGSIAGWQSDEIEKAVQARLVQHLLAKFGPSRFPQGFFGEDGKPADAI